MKLLLLGTGGYHPSNLRQTACLFLPQAGAVLDAGTGLFRLRDHLATPTLDIFLTHAHLDHIVGLTYLLDTLWRRNVSRVTVHGDEPTLAAVQTHLFASAIFPVKPDCDFIPLADVIRLADGGKLTHFALTHPGGSRGFRLDWPDRSLAYVTDTTASLHAPYLPHIQGVDLLVHECYFSDAWAERAQLTGHSCTSAVAQIAAQVGAKQLVLVHVNPLDSMPDPVGVEVAQQIFPHTHLACDGAEIEF